MSRFFCGLLLTVMLMSGSPTAAATAQGSFFPRASHHQHLVSPATSILWSSVPLAEVAVPQPFRRVVEAQIAAFGDPAALARLYTDDAVLLVSNEPGWVRGPADIGRQLAGTFGRPYRVTAVGVETGDTTGRIVGYLTRGEGDAARPFAHVFLTLRKGGDDTWRISAETILFAPPRTVAPMDADRLIADMDAAHIERAAVLSVAYLYGDPRRQVEDEYARVRAENDWTAAQVARHPNRLIAFCGFSPLRPYALEELERCARLPHVRGIKLHFGNSGVDLRNPDHVASIARVFAAANARRLPIVVHLKTRATDYGGRDAQVFLDDILPMAPDIVVQVAHMAGSGPGYPAFADQAFEVLAEAIARNDPRTQNVIFDVATVVTMDTSPETAELIARRVRQVGVGRFVFGADLAIGEDGNPPPRQAWAAFRMMLPLTDSEFETIARHVLPYLL